MLTREQTIECYMINEKHVIAELLYDTITKYETKLEELQNRSCKNCNNFELSEWCTIFNYELCETDYCSRFEPKDKE